MTSDVEYFKKFTPRERTYLRLLVTGTTTNKEIASAMGIKLSWVQRYATHLFEKTGTDNRMALALFVVRRPELEALLTKEGGA